MLFTICYVLFKKRIMGKVIDLGTAKCEIDGCKNTGAISDHDGVLKCQEHLVDEIFKKRPKLVKLGRNDPCSCGSELKAKKCCLNEANLNRQWLLQRIGTLIYYKNKPICTIENCEDCKTWDKGVRIKDSAHARLLDDYSKENDIQFTNINDKDWKTNKKAK